MTKQITPSDIAARGTEHGHQAALFAWRAVAAQYGFEVAADWCAGMGLEAAKSSRTNFIPRGELMLLFAIANGGERNKIVAARLKAEGVQSGVPDLMLPVARHNCHGLFIELKKPKQNRKSAGKTSKKQDEWIDKLRTQGYGACSCSGWEAARDILIQYLS